MFTCLFYLFTCLGFRAFCVCLNVSSLFVSFFGYLLSCLFCCACLLACFTSLFVNVLFAANALLHRLHVLQLSILYLCKRHHIYIYVFTYLSLFFRLAAYSVYFSAFNFF